ncbi:MAG: penicillin-binding protein 2 [Treponema sp.]|nr:penicillin-binding protein 2 [Treponema sp.]
MKATFFQLSEDVSDKKNFRLFIVFCIIVVVFALYLLRLLSMQTVESSYYSDRAVARKNYVTVLDAKRGEIFDCHVDEENVQPLVTNTDAFAVELIPGEIPDGEYDTVASKLADYLGMSKAIIDQLTTGKRRSNEPIQIKINVPLTSISNIAENIVELPGVSWKNKPIRTYNESGSISHILGYVGKISKEQAKLLNNEGYTENSIIGQAGIESQYDKLLQGIPGSESRTRDAQMRFTDDPPEIVPPKMGNTLVLTVDTRIQKLAEETLGERVGAIVVLKPATGEVLAMVSYPFYDSNLFSSENFSNEYARLLQNPNRPLLNRAINSAYPPASTFKTIMTTAVLSEKKISPDKKIECTGELFHGGIHFHCHKKAPGHGWIDLKNGLAQSCDVYFWIIGRDYLGGDLIAQYAMEFGFGQSLQIDLPGQASGFVPTAQWKSRENLGKWTDGDTMNMSIGQGYTTATPMHVANMMAMICNSGVIYKPHFLKEVRDANTGEVIQTVEPEVLHESTVAKSVWRTVQTDLRYTISDGTAVYPMGNKLVKIAGKTGTAETGRYTDRWHSWMVAYAPYDAPVEDQIVVTSLVEDINEWEWWSPYATNIVIQGIFANQTYEESIKTLGFEYLKKQVGRQE